jgi:hypothetical protein
VDEAGPALPAGRHGALLREDPEALGLWRGILGDFLDRKAARRFHQDAASRAAARWKPKLALVLPEGFSTRRPAHRRDLTVALEILASVMGQYHLEVVSDSPEASRLFHGVVPFSHRPIAACRGALVLLSRSLTDEVGAIRPCRYVAADPCASRTHEERIVFAAGALDRSFVPAEDGEVVREGRGSVSVLLDEDESVPSFLDALRRLRARGLPLCLTLSTRADDDFARRVRAAFHGDPRVEVRDPEPHGSEDRPEFQVSNDPITLLTQRPSLGPRLLFRRSRLWRWHPTDPCRSDWYLFRGEESNPHGLLAIWLGRHDSPGARPANPHNAGTVEPLVSIVVPVHDRAVEVLRLAHSIYVQDYPWIEVVFVAHGSPPETLEAIRAAENYLMKRRFSVQIIELTRTYPSGAIPRDLGIRASSGDLVCGLDADDWLEPGFFDFLRGQPWRDDTLYNPRKIHQDPGQASGDGFPADRLISAPGTDESAERASDRPDQGHFPGESGVCFARALFDRPAGIDERSGCGEDPDPRGPAARAEEHDGRVNTARRPGHGERLRDGGSRLEEPYERTGSQEPSP